MTKKLNNIQAATKGYERLTAVLDAHGMPVVVEMVSMLGFNLREMSGRGESAIIADMIGRIPEDEWTTGVSLAHGAHRDFWEAAVALQAKHGQDS